MTSFLARQCIILVKYDDSWCRTEMQADSICASTVVLQKPTVAGGRDLIHNSLYSKALRATKSLDSTMFRPQMPWDIFFSYQISRRVMVIVVSIKWPNALPRATVAYNVSHFAAIHFCCTPHYAVSHHGNAITPTPPQLLLIATDKSPMWHIRDTLPNLSEYGVSVVPNAVAPTAQIWNRDTVTNNKRNMCQPLNTSYFRIYTFSTWAQ